MKKIAVKISILALVLLLIGSMAGAQYQAWDPTRQIPNGRVIGLGKAYMALADDTAAIYSNPAGLANIKHWQICSMSGTFLEEYNYISLSGAYPTQFGVLGMGFAGSSIGGAYVTKVKEGSDPADPIYEIDFSLPPVSNYNNVMILSWGNRADEFLSGLRLDQIGFLKHPFFSSLSLGANLKFFSAGLSGDSIAGGAGDASGNELDLGLQYQPPQKWMKFGVTAQNLLPFSMGGKLRYATGHEESYPAILESGVVVRLLGEQDALVKYRDQEVLLVLDMDYYPTLSNYPMLYHAGVEWKPSPMIAIRMGIDQDVSANNGGLGAISNVTGGMGLTFGGFRFDYAYHQFEAAPGITNSFFSLSYGLFPPEKEYKDPIEARPDKLVTFESSVVVKGTAVDPAIVEVRIKGEKVKLGMKGEFAYKVPLTVGKNAVMVEGFNKDGKLVGSEKLRILRLITYPDVASDYWTYEQVGYIGTLGIIKGYPDGNFKPEGDITRAEMATLLVRTQAGGDENVPPATLALFPDVKIEHWASKYVNQASRTGIVLGYPDGTFKPSGNITRAEGLTMITRFSSVSEEAYANQFSDVSADHWAARTISGAARAGMLEYLSGRPFRPSQKLTRAESVEILFRSPYVQDVIKNDLLNWETY